MTNNTPTQNAHSTEIIRRSLIGRLLRNPLTLVSGSFLLILVVSGVFAQFLAPFDPQATDINAVLSPINSKHLLGTDSAGRDVLSRIIFGVQSTLISAVITIVTSIVIGVPAGMIAGYFGRKLDAVSNWISNMLQSLPAIIVLLAVSASFGNSIFVSMFVFGVLITPGFFRLTRTAVMGVRNELYVDAARVSGLGDFRIIIRHIFGVVRAPIIIQAAMISGIAISVQSGLAFLGLGDPKLISWGVMLNEGFVNIFSSPTLVVWPGLAISSTIGAFALLGNAIRDALEDSQKVETSSSKSKYKRNSSKLATNDSSKSKSNHMLTVQNLSVGYAQGDGSLKKVVSDVSFELNKGEVLGIVGESGSGKSQTAFSILGLLPANAIIASGHIEFEGHELVSRETGAIRQKELAAFRGKRIAYIPQEPMSNLDPAFTIGYQLIRPVTQILKLSKDEARKKVLGILDMVGIVNPERVMSLYPHEISGGMAQRVLIAGAISCEPDLLIADEPTTALDVTVQAEVLDLLRDLQKRLGMGMVLVTHNFGVVADLADRVIVMQYGKVVEQGGVRELLRSPQEPYTKILLGSMLEGKTPMTMLTESQRDSK